MSVTLCIHLPLKLVNGSNAREAHWGARKRRAADHIAAVRMRLAVEPCWPLRLPVQVTVIRIAPSKGLDPHDGLPTSAKHVVDGVALALGLESDRDPRVTWKYEQRRPCPGDAVVKGYGVVVEVREVEG